MNIVLTRLLDLFKTPISLTMLQLIHIVYINDKMVAERLAKHVVGVPKFYPNGDGYNDYWNVK
jgi:hypothetical protein